ncbi:MAG: prepilin-type N-terminal cleavage/methylation domain-containing protein, partial [Candidatus Pacebacteria bacterium]|nr:prepilin-type N-terminal cleavage/methylation domain-containing protein [Candidatus Paceibacterota bacterium]
MNKNKKKGFTLIELLVVATIITILSAIGLVSFVNAGKGARDAKRKADLETVRQALVLRRSDLGNYPSGGAG